MGMRLGSDERIGFLKPSLDAHTLGLGSIGELLSECGVRTETADRELSQAVDAAAPELLARLLAAWFARSRITALGFSYRLDPRDAVRLFGRVIEALARGRLLLKDGGPIRALYFAGLPPACDLVAERFPFVTALFRGDETPAESLSALGVDPDRIPSSLAAGVAYY